jgi:hypothetical protein
MHVPDTVLSGSKHHQGSTIPKITPLEPKHPVQRTGAVKVAPTPTLIGRGEKRGKP